jgi:hypothetical protein|eukprot:SAG25_NODE_113_length_14872_cov_23.149527_21_plen_370_part_00
MFGLILLPLLCAAHEAHAAAAPSHQGGVWPPPQHITAVGPALALHPQFTVTAVHTGSKKHQEASSSGSSSARQLLGNAIARHRQTIAPALLSAAAAAPHTTAAALRELVLEVGSDDEHLGRSTQYDYNITIDDTRQPPSARASCTTIYGCFYALETFTQLLDFARGALRHGAVEVVDAPDFAWRGLMVDAGRRFFPMDTLKDLMQTMAANKLNVLHLHASGECCPSSCAVCGAFPAQSGLWRWFAADFCRWGVESKLYPNLTNALTGIKAGHYSQEDIKELIAYGKSLGIRIVPEFDIPGHSKVISGWVASARPLFCPDVVRCLRYTTQGFEPLAWGPHPDVFFCDGDPATGNQLYHLRHIIIRAGILN